MNPDRHLIQFMVLEHYSQLDGHPFSIHLLVVGSKAAPVLHVTHFSTALLLWHVKQLSLHLTQVSSLLN